MCQQDIKTAIKNFYMYTVKWRDLCRSDKFCHFCIKHVFGIYSYPHISYWCPDHVYIILCQLYCQTPVEKIFNSNNVQYIH